MSSTTRVAILGLPLSAFASAPAATTKTKRHTTKPEKEV